MNNDLEQELKELYKRYDKLLQERNKLNKENKLLKKDLKEYQAYIKKGVEEHYKEFMQDYDVLLEEYNELNKNYKILKKDLLYLKKNSVELYVFPNGRKILGIDINDIPSEIENLKDIINNIMEELKDE